MNKWMKSTALESWLYSNYIPLPWKFFKHLPLLTRPAISQGPAMMQSVDCWIFNFLSHHSSTELPQWLLNRTHHNYLWDLKEDVCIHTHTHTHTHIYTHVHIQVFTLLTKVCLVKVMVFPVVMYGCENWTIKKAEHQRTDVFALWC